MLIKNTLVLASMLFFQPFVLGQQVAPLDHELGKNSQNLMYAQPSTQLLLPESWLTDHSEEQFVSANDSQEYGSIEIKPAPWNSKMTSPLSLVNHVGIKSDLDFVSETYPLNEGKKTERGLAAASESAQEANSQPSAANEGDVAPTATPSIKTE